jgi:putative ABC transport system permease protein
MLIPKLAFRNIIGAGLRTWLNVIVLSIAFVAIIWTQGMLKGMNDQAMTAMIDTEIGGGQFWHQAYDPFDPLTIEDAHAPLSPSLADLVAKGSATPILVTSGAIYPQGRIQTALLKGIEPGQQIINIPSGVLKSENPDVIPALIGSRMAKQTHLKIGDEVTVRWRDIHGTFDATDVQIVQIMSTSVQSVDSGQIWIPLDRLREMLQAPEEATFVVVAKNLEAIPPGDPTWIFHDLEDLLKDIKQLIRNKSVGSSIMYVLLLGMGLLAIFDTQVLSIFRRRKEMGTLMALGMSRGKVIGLFTFEGALHGIMALLIGAVYGIPLLTYSAKTGIGLPKEVMDSFGVAISDTLYPSYGLRLVIGTTLLVLMTVTIVSFLPTRRIAKLKPTDALRGKLS